MSATGGVARGSAARVSAGRRNVGGGTEVGGGTDALQRCIGMQDRLVQQLAAYCGDRDVAEDIAQDVMEIAARQGPALDDVEVLWAWLWRVGVNRTHSHYRRGQLAARVASLHHAERRTSDPSEGVAVLDLVARLPSRERRVLWLRHVEQRSVAETADLLAVAQGTVKSISSRTLSRLRAQLS